MPKSIQEVTLALQAIADGEDFYVLAGDAVNGTFVVVTNPKFQEDNGSNPRLVFAVKVD